jgi:hypothetical protein
VNCKMTLAKSSPSFKSPHSNMPRKYEHTYGRINIGALVVAVAVVGYLYYQRTRNDITIQVPKLELKP